MFDNVVSGGCSLCWGAELEDRNQRYSKLIADHYGAKLNDFSHGGIGNESISFRLIDGLINLTKKPTFNRERTLVIASWSYFSRLNYFNPKSKKFLVLSSVGFKKHYHNTMGNRKSDEHLDSIDLEFFYRNHDHILYFLYNTIKHIYMTQLFLENHGIKYVFTFNSEHCYKHLFIKTLNASYDDPFEEGNRLPNIINLSKQIDQKKVYKTFLGTFTDQHKFPEGPGGHPLEKAHQEYSKGLIKFIEETYA